MNMRSIVSRQTCCLCLLGWLSGFALASGEEPATLPRAGSVRQVAMLMRHAEQNILQEDYASAIKDLLIVLEARPTHLKARRRLASCLATTEQFAMADQQYRYILRQKPGDVESFYGIAWINEKSRRYENAIAMYRATLRLAPQHVVSLNNLAWLLATSPVESQRNGDQAVQLVKLAIQLRGGTEWHTADTLAAAHAEAGQFDQAVEALSSALTTVPAEHEAELKARLRLYEQGQPYRLPE